MPDDFDTPSDFNSIYDSVVGSADAGTASDNSDPLPTPPAELGTSTADANAGTADALSEANAPAEIAPPPTQPSKPAAAADDEFFLGDDFTLDDEILEAPELETLPQDDDLPTLERFASVTDPEERADLERLIAAASNRNAGAEFAPLAQPLEMVGGVENASKILNIIGMGMQGNVPVVAPDGRELGMTHVQWSVKALDAENREFFDNFVGQALTYAPELAYEKLPDLLNALDTDKKLPPELRSKVNEYLDEYAQRKGYELNIDGETQEQMIGEMQPNEIRLFNQLPGEDRKAIVEMYRDYGLTRALNMFDASVTNWQTAEKAKAKETEAVIEQNFDKGLESNASFSKHLEGVHDAYVNKLVQQGVDSVRAEGLVALAYKALNRGFYDKNSQDHQVLIQFQQALLPKELRLPKYRDIAATPQERKTLETAVQRVFKAQVDKAVERFRRPAPGAPKPPANTRTAQQPQQQPQQPAAQRQPAPADEPTAPATDFVPTTADDIERIINQAMALQRR